MPIAFDRNTCCDLNETISREWLITNGQGGYAAGTIAGTLTRMQHGLLVAPPAEWETHQLLLAKLDEEIVFDQRTYYLGTNEYKDGTLNPAGFVHLESFRLEEGFPVFTYHLGGIDGIVLEKRIWMPQGLNTTYIHYRVVRTASPELIGQQHRYQEPSHRPSYPSRFLEDAHASQRVLSLTLLPYASYRPIHEPLHGRLDWQFEVEPQHIEQDPDSLEQPQSIAGCSIRARAGARPYHIFAVGPPGSQITFLPTGVWYWNFLHREGQVAARPGQAATDDLYLPGVFRARLWPGDDVELTIIVTAEDLSWQSFNPRQLKRAYAEAVEYQRDLALAQRYFGDGGVATHMHPVLPLSREQPGMPDALSAEEFLRVLLQAGSRFLAQRALPFNEAGGRPSMIFPSSQTIPTILSGYYDLTERTRDMLIALPGLTLATRRDGEARRMLLTLSRYFKEGLLPERLPTLEQPLSDEDYGSVDTTLWYFYALDAYLGATHDDNVLEDLYPELENSITRLVRGTRNGIRVDSRDGLLLAHQPGKALTWMNASVGGAGDEPTTPLTPRSGKPVEVNALWYLALSLMQEWSKRLSYRGSIPRAANAYEELGRQCKRSFNERFWYGEGGYLYDVIDDPQGDDASLRPNQLFAMSLRHPVLDVTHRRAVLDIVTQRLLTPYGLRSLAPQCDGYTGRIQDRGATNGERERAQYNGGAWPWLVGAYIDAMLQVQGIDDDVTRAGEQADKNAAWRKGVELLDFYRRQTGYAILGMFASVYDGDEPQKPHVQLASARSVGELLRAYKLLAHLGIRHADQTLPV
jgi:glycogen debranching enzyme